MENEMRGLLGGTQGLAPNAKHEAMERARQCGVTPDDYKLHLLQRDSALALKHDYERQLHGLKSSQS
jgi:hypothetical protein